jgi:UDP-glucose 4-epimerase
MTILLTGGTGFIGSHTALALQEVGYEVLLLDNLCNSNINVIDRLFAISGHRFRFIQGDVRDSSLLETIFKDFAIESVIHFAGLKAVGESIARPLEYYENNVQGSLNLLSCMDRHKVFRFVFSSSATVYGNPHYLPIDEEHPKSATNPYASSKLQVEQILQDLANSDPHWRIACLRYFNPVGAHASGLIGENPNGIPNNLMPYISQVASGQLKKLNIFGDDYPTVDGTGVRDYLHITDLAEGHLAAVKYLHNSTGFNCFNLGTGSGSSVKEMVSTFEKVNRVKIPFDVVSRRPGDVASCYAKVEKSNLELNWKAKKGLDEMCISAWKWQQKLQRND